MMQRNAQWLLALSTLMIPLFYVTGYFYDRGYVESYGLEYSGFTKDVSYYLVNNVVLLIHSLNDVVTDAGKIGNAVLSVIFLIIYLSVLWCLMGFLSSSPNRDARFIKNIQDKFGAIKIISMIVLNVWKLIKLAVVVFLSVVFVVLFSALSYDKGRDLAKMEMRQPLACNENKISCVYVSNKPNSSEPNFLGRIVTNNESDYAIWTGSEVILHPHDSSLKISVPH